MNRLTLKLLKSRPLGLVYRPPRFGYSNVWVGAFPSWDAAMAAIPAGNPVGYNQEGAKKMFAGYPTSYVRPSDYAVVVHLRNALKAGSRVVDVGGSIGTAYYIAQKYFDLPDGLEWRIYDVPEVLEAGRQVAEREGEKSKSLSFIDKLTDAGTCDLFFSSGSLQLIKETLPTLLQKLPLLPQHVLINRIPVWDREAIVSLNDMGFSLAPYNIFNRKKWVDSVEALGYKLMDDWACPESQFVVRYQPKLRLNSYRGFYFLRNS